MNYELICKQTVELSQEIGKFLQQEVGKINDDNLEKKGYNNFVTYVDKTSEKLLVEGLLKILPESDFIAEEETEKQTQKDFTWIIDPLDGTTNFVHALPCYCISIALQQNGKTVLGVVHIPTLSETFYAWQGSKAYLNNKEIKVSQTQTLSESLIAHGFPYEEYEKMDAYIDLMRYFLKETHGVRRWGAAAMDLVYVACGRYEGYYECDLSPWDVAAGSFILQQAGGKVTDFSGGNDYIFGKEIIAGNSKVFNEFLSIVKQYLK
jgi:myo-inositol-1(or 4)-monophosphatase